LEKLGKEWALGRKDDGGGGKNNWKSYQEEEIP